MTGEVPGRQRAHGGAARVLLQGVPKIGRIDSEGALHVQGIESMQTQGSNNGSTNMTRLSADAGQVFRVDTKSGSTASRRRNTPLASRERSCGRLGR